MVLGCPSAAALIPAGIMTARRRSQSHRVSPSSGHEVCATTRRILILTLEMQGMCIPSGAGMVLGEGRRRDNVRNDGWVLGAPLGRCGPIFLLDGEKVWGKGKMGGNLLF